MKSKIIIAILLSVAGAHAGTILTENFDELTAKLAVTSAGALTAVDGTNVDIVGTADGFGYLCAAPESGNCVDMDGSGGASEGVLASGMMVLEPGYNYYLSYDLIGSDRGVTTSTTVTFGSYSQTFSLGSADTTSGIVNDALITVSAPTPTQLIFTSNTPGNIGSVLDDVLIISTPANEVAGGVPASAATPETPTSILLISGLVAAAWKYRRWAKSDLNRLAHEQKVCNG